VNTLSAAAPSEISPSSATAEGCYHCGLPIPPGEMLTVPAEGDAKPVCCHGCEAAYYWLKDQGLDRYYALREAGLGHAAKAEMPAWASPEVAARYVTRDGENAELVLALSGLRCAACAWLAEKGVATLPAVQHAQVQLATERLHLRWTGDESAVPAIAERLSALGFDAAPARSEAAAELRRKEHRKGLARLGIAALITMQIMMLSLADYLDLLSDLTPAYRQLLLWAQAVLATVLVTTSAAPFFQGAWRALKQKQLTMDVPVALALGLAYGASIALLVTGRTAQGAHVYFDSLVMFTFFLLAGRYAEARLRHQFAQSDPTLEDLLPLTALRLRSGEAGEEARETLHPMDLSPGDRILVSAGQTVPCEALVLEGSAALRLDHLTGEAAPQPCSPGTAVPAGATVLDGVLTLTVRQRASEGRLAALPTLLARARKSQSGETPLLDRIARHFFAFQLLIALGAGVLWLVLAPERAFEIVLATLIIACPCALSLATPAARTTGALALRQQGLRLGRSDSLERLASINRVVLDKTGTLTEPTGTLSCLEGPASAWALAKALERDIDHPLARAFQARPEAAPAVSAQRVVVGEGVEGCVNGIAYRLGRPRFAGTEGTGVVLSRADAESPSGWTLLARFQSQEALRPEAPEALAALRAQGVKLALLSGDHGDRVAAVAAELGLETWEGDATPEAKLEALARLRAAGERVLYVGDGLNDAPALGGAEVSLALGAESRFAQDAADIVSFRRDLRTVPYALGIARSQRRRLHRNLLWAAGYNVAAVPLAVAGFVTPWLAALGMTLSSLIVLVHAQRLARDGAQHRRGLWKV